MSTNTHAAGPVTSAPAAPETHNELHDHAPPGSTYLTYPKGILSWLLTMDHKRLGIMYGTTILASFGLGGLLAMIIRLWLMWPDMKFVKYLEQYGHITLAHPEKTYNQIMTLHGAVMIFFFIIPSIPAALGNFVLPLHLGARDVAFPKINLMSYYFYVTGCLLMLISLLIGQIDTGWTFYAPYSTAKADNSVILVTLGAFMIGFSSIFTGLNFMTTIHKMRAPGMTWFQMPMFVWGIYATSIIQLLATPVLGITLLLLIAERALGIGIFDQDMGGDPVLFQHFFWFYSHPAVYIMILPGMAIISEVVAVHSHKKLFGYKLIGFSSIAIALLGFLVWGHHMFVSSESPYSATVFSFLTFFIAVPSGIKVFNWMATMYRGQIAWTTPMLYAVTFLILFAIGGLTGIFLATLSVDVHLNNTYFVVAHFHYVMMGGTVIALLAGLHHWWPKITGKMYHDGAAFLAWLLIFVGFNLCFYSQFIMGVKGMPRRYASYAGTLNTDFYQQMHGFSSIGSLIMGIGFLVMLGYLLHSLRYGKTAPANPWGGLTFEWAIPSPPKAQNFPADPVVKHGPYDYDKVLPQNI